MMNKLQSLVRGSVIGGAIAMGLGMPLQALGAVGQCVAADKIKDYEVNFSRKFESPDENSGNQIFVNVSEGVWDRSDGYKINCDCGPGVTMMNESFILAKSRGVFDRNIYVKKRGKNLSFYTLSGSEDFSAAAEVFIAGAVNDYFPVPFNDFIGNGFTNRPQDCAGEVYDSGSKGFVHLYFRQPVIGTSTIAKSELVDIFINSQKGLSTPGTRVAVVTVQGTITVPQKCELKNSMITVPFGTIMSTDFKEVGKKPSTVRIHEETLYLECTNLSTRAKISLLFEGEVNPHDTTALKTKTTNGSVTADNDDIAIRIEERRNGNTRVISPGDKLSMTMNGLGNIDSDSQTTLAFYPISTTGKAPAVGDFEATATITVKME